MTLKGRFFIIRRETLSAFRIVQQWLGTAVCIPSFPVNYLSYLCLLIYFLSLSNLALDLNSFLIVFKCSVFSVFPPPSPFPPPPPPTNSALWDFAYLCPQHRNWWPQFSVISLLFIWASHSWSCADVMISCWWAFLQQSIIIPKCL